MNEKFMLMNFEHVIKTWKPDLCSCRLCKVYLQNIAYLQSAFIPFALPYIIHFPSLFSCLLEFMKFI